MIDISQTQEPINTDKECPVIPVYDYDLQRHILPPR